MTAIWSSAVNSDNLVAPGELAKETQTKGTFQDDYNTFCSQFNVVACSMHIKSTNYENDSESTLNVCRISNCCIDLSNWRCALLACSTIGSKINEIHIHNAKITANHLEDLIVVIEKMGILSKLRIEYLTLESALGNETDVDPAEIEMKESLKNLLSGNVAMIENISLKGNKFGDNYISSCLPAIQSNLVLKSLNLSDNHLTNDVCVYIFKMLRLNVALSELILSKNKIDEDFSFNDLSTLSLGSPATGDDDAWFKGLTKAIGDRNKNIKEFNKKRKKSGQADINELPNFENRIFKVDKDSNILINKVVSFIDLSYNNQLILGTDTLSTFFNTVKEKAGSAAGFVGVGSITLNIFCYGVYLDKSVLKARLEEVASLGICINFIYE